MPHQRFQAVPVDEPGEQSRKLCAALLAVQEAAQENAVLRQKLDAIEASRSWTLTAPLRKWRAARKAPDTGVAQALPPAAADDGRGRLMADPTRLLRQRIGVASSAEAGRRQLFVDVTELAREDLGAGIQRTVRRLLLELLLEPPAGYRVEPVRLAGDGSYAHARGFLARLLGLSPKDAGSDLVIEPRRGDLFLGLDLIRDHATLAQPVLQVLRARGVKIAFVVYDLLPLSRPEWFPAGMGARYGQWLGVLAETADTALCISADVREQLRRELSKGPGDARQVEVGHFPLGADLGDWVMPQAVLPPLARGSARFLMVGTIEPRKGHAQALGAFEQLWAAGSDVELVIAGRAGWSVEALLERLRQHPEAGKRLHWIEGGNDSRLAAAYRESTVLLAGSFGEGYGLPLVEAATLGLPLLVRDLRVFREVAGAGANYFAGEEPADLARAIGHWLQSWARGDLADPRNVLMHTWRQSADTLKRILPLEAPAGRSESAPGSAPPRMG